MARAAIQLRMPSRSGSSAYIEIFLTGDSEDSIDTLVFQGGDEKTRTFDCLRLVRVHSECSYVGDHLVSNTTEVMLTVENR